MAVFEYAIEGTDQTYQVEAENEEEALELVKQVYNQQVTNEASSLEAAAEQQNAERLKNLSGVLNNVAETPLGSPRVDPRQTQGRLGRVVPPRPDEDWVLENQAWKRGVDIHSGSDSFVRLGQALADTKDPTFRMNLLDNHFRQNLQDHGIEIPPDVPVVMAEQQTGKLAYLRPITEDDVERYGEDPANVGRTRLTLVDPGEMELADMVDVLPMISIGAVETAGSALASFAGSPAAALWGQAAITAFANGVAEPTKNWLLKNHWGMSDEEIEQHGTTNAWNQAMFAGGFDLAMGYGGILLRHLRSKSSNRVLTKDDYDAIVAEYKELEKLSADFKRATGQTIDNPILFTQSAANRSLSETGAQLAVRSAQLLRRLGSKRKAELSTLEQVTRAKLARGFGVIQNNTVDGMDLHRIKFDENDIIMPRGDLANLADEAVAVLRKDFGVDAAHMRAVQGQETFDKAFAELNDGVLALAYKDIQQIGKNDLLMLQGNEAMQWNVWRSYLEESQSGQAGVALRNTNRSPIRRTLNSLERSAKRNLSETEGAATMAMVKDLEKLREGVLDIGELHRLRSDLLRKKRNLLNGSDPSGWKVTELDEVIDSITATMADTKNAPWFRIETGKNIPRQQQDAMNIYALAGESTRVNDVVTSRAFLRDMTKEIREIDPKTMRFFGERKVFDMMPSQVREALFAPRQPGALRDLFMLSGRNPNIRAALANELEAIYKKRALNPDGTFARGGYQSFIDDYDGHMELLFGPKQAARITNADQMGRAVLDLNKRAKQMERAFAEEFGSLGDKNALSSVSIVDHMMTSTRATPEKISRFMNRIGRLDPGMIPAIRADFAQYAYRELMVSPIETKNGNAIRNFMGKNVSKIRRIMGDRYWQDMRALQRITDMTDLAMKAKASSDPIQAAWLQITRSVFGPLSKKQRFMTAANRVLRATHAERAIEYMADPQKLHKFMQLEKLKPGSIAFWTRVNSLGLRSLFEAEGVSVPDPEELEQRAAKEQAMRNLAMGGPL